jgi:hypothetical protein
VATGLNFPDALAGGAPAGWAGGPILLVTPDSIPDPTGEALQSIRPTSIVALGGTTVVSDAVMVQLAQYLP